ncbi:MAG: hypothetical protein RR984_02770 [Bacilli bacterium]
MKEKLEKLILNSYSPYSLHPSACIIEDEHGNFYNGVNVENASYGATISSVASALSSAISSRCSTIKVVYYYTNSNKLQYPNYSDKQLLVEHINENTIFNIMNSQNEMHVLTYKQMMEEKTI